MARANFIRSVFPVLLLTASVTACTNLNSAGDLERTWKNAFVVVPYDGGAIRSNTSKLTTILANQDRSTALPVLIHMHGCTGIGDMEREFGISMAKAGFVFIAPDSMARRFRPLQCDPKTQTGGYNRFVFDFRQSEIAYALHRLSSEPWADMDRLFLMGGSEGGVAAALYRGDEFSARVIVQWTCHGAPVVRGLAAPEHSPVLAIVNKGDPWYQPDHTNGQSGDCGAFFGGRPDSLSLVLDRSGVHDVLDLPGIRNQIRSFLVKQSLPR